jgi:hypothetical protein
VWLRAPRRHVSLLNDGEMTEGTTAGRIGISSLQLTNLSWPPAVKQSAGIARRLDLPDSKHGVVTQNSRVEPQNHIQSYCNSKSSSHYLFSLHPVCLLSRLILPQGTAVSLSESHMMYFLRKLTERVSSGCLSMDQIAHTLRTDR